MNISKNKTQELTGFQEYAPWNGTINLQTDYMMSYGYDHSSPERLQSWKEKGYRLHFMTGISWGHYQDYLYGEYDGTDHSDEGQRMYDGTEINHGKTIPYMVPTLDFSNYMVEKLKPVIDAGVLAVHLEEPEFWMRAGYSDAFKREWELYYKEPWIAPNSSPDAQFRASKLKAYLYTRMLDRVCSALKAYAKKKYNRDVRFYVPTHSLLNYSTWGIISPESNLIDLPSVDGYIAQIWTGTSRSPNYYNGVWKERTFETAYLEYGVMQELARGTGRRMWFLHDPIEDDPGYDWADYRYNYYRTLVASLLHDKVHHFEVCPWPNRVYNGKYPVGAENPQPIPQTYAMELSILTNMLRDMQQTEVTAEGNQCKVGVVISDSAMYQRMDFRNQKKEAYEGNDFSGFFGMALPLLKYGLPVKPVQLDNVRRFSSYLEEYDMLIMSYEFMKPEFPDVHNAIAQWVANGGVLVYVGDGSDLYHTVRHWWNQGANRYADPSEHLLSSMEKRRERVLSDRTKLYHVGKGILTVMKQSPWQIAMDSNLAEEFRKTVLASMRASSNQALTWKPRNSFVLHRGPYVIGACMDEGVNEKSVSVKGMFVDLLEADLPVKKRTVLKPDDVCVLYDVTKAPLHTEVEVDEGKTASFSVYPIAASCRLSWAEEVQKDMPEAKVVFYAEGPANVKGIARFAYDPAEQPATCTLLNAKGKKVRTLPVRFHEASNTLLVRFPAAQDGLYLVFA